MSKLHRVNTSSKEYTTTKTWAEKQNRGYLFIVVTSGSVDIEFGNGGGSIPLAAGAHYEPYVCPTSEFTVTCTSGTYVVHSDQQVA